MEAATLGRMEDGIVFDNIKYKGVDGWLSLTDELLWYQAYPPRKVSVRLSWALIRKQQVSSRSASQQYIRVVTSSDKQASFYPKDRETLEEIRLGIKVRHERMRQERAQQKQQLERQSSTPRLMQSLFYYLSPGRQTNHSSLAQQALEEDETFLIQQKYAHEIEQDATITALEEQIQKIRNDLQRQRMQKEEINKLNMQLQKEQATLNDLALRLRLSLADIIFADNTSVDEEMSQNSTYQKRQQAKRREYTKAVQKAAASRKTPSANMYNLTSVGASKHQDKEKRKRDKEALETETTLLQTMHHQMVLQNQTSIAQKNSLIVKSYLQREKSQLDDLLAEDMQFKMVLEGTDNAMSDLYHDIIVRQEYLMDRLQPKVGASDTNGSAVPPLILSPQAMRLNAPKRRGSVTKSDGISDLGESLRNGRSRTDKEPEEYHPPAAMTTVHSLQMSTLNEMADGKL